MRYVYSLVLFLFFLGSQLFSQQYNFINYSVENGLIQSQVNSLCQDDKGYIWVGTLGGVSKFDGVNFVNYSTLDGLINNQVNAIFNDSKGRLWFGSLGGVSIREKGRFSSLEFDFKLKNHFVLNISEDKDGVIWMVTDGGGVVKYYEGKLSYIKIDEPVKANYVRHVFCDEENNKWFATRNGIYVMFPDGAIKDTLLGVNATQVYVGEDEVWCSTYGMGVALISKSGTKYLSPEDGLIHSHIRAFSRKKDGAFWFVSKFGLSKYSNGVFKNFKHADGLSNENIRNIVEDVEGNLFFGSDGGGLLKFTGESFVSYGEEDGLRSGIVMDISEGEHNSLWFSTYGKGVCKSSNGKYTFYDETDGLANNTVWCSAVAKDNTPWFGTSSGFSYLKGGKFKTIDTKSGLNSNKVYALAFDLDQNLLIGTKEGLSKYYLQKDSIYNYEGDHEVAKNIREIVYENEQSIWICSSEGLVNYNNENHKRKHYTVKDGLPDNSVVSVVKDAKNNLWIGTKNGLAYFSSGKIKSVPIADNYSSNNVVFLTIDKYENLWIGTNNGLFQLSYDNVSNITKSSFVRYSNLDGLKSLECNQNAVYIDSENELWFGTSLGLMKHTLNKSNKVVNYPKVNLKDVRLFFERPNWEKQFNASIDSLGLPSSLLLPYNKNHLTFDFDGIYHKSPDKVKYRYMLEGFDEKWQPITNVSFVTYSNIPFGSYKFVLSASVDQVNWTTPRNFEFEIKAPFWFTWWFYSLVFVVVCLVVWLIINRRVKVIEQKRERELLENQAKMLELEQQALNASLNRHFIFNSLNSIQYYINRQDRISANKYLSNFAKLVRKNLDSSLENETDVEEEIERIDLYLKLEQMRFQNKFDYTINCGKGVLNQSLKIPSMLLQPYVENSIWHGILPADKQGDILLDVQRNDNTLSIKIKDNGIGIEASLKKKENKTVIHDSKGMELTKGRISLHSKLSKRSCIVQGPYQIYEKNGDVAGTEVSILINLQ